MNREERLQNIIDNLEDAELISIWNEIQDANSYYEDHIYYMYEIDELFHDVKVSEFLSNLADDFRVGDDYFKDGVWGIESFNDIYDVIDDDEIINYIIGTEEDFGNDDIREILDEEEEEDEEVC